MDLFWIKDKSLADMENLPDPDVLAGENLTSFVEAQARFYPFHPR